MPMLTPRRRDAPPLVWRLFCQEHLALSERQAATWWHALRRSTAPRAVQLRSAVLCRGALPHTRAALEHLVPHSLHPHALIGTLEDLVSADLLPWSESRALQSGSWRRRTAPATGRAPMEPPERLWCTRCRTEARLPRQRWGRRCLTQYKRERAARLRALEEPRWEPVIPAPVLVEMPLHLCGLCGAHRWFEHQPGCGDVNSAAARHRKGTVWNPRLCSPHARRALSAERGHANPFAGSVRPVSTRCSSPKATPLPVSTTRIAWPMRPGGRWTAPRLRWSSRPRRRAPAAALSAGRHGSRAALPVPRVASVLEKRGRWRLHLAETCRD